MYDRFAHAVQRDRAAHVHAITPAALRGAMELDFVHQTVLRFAYERIPDPALVGRYLVSPALRDALLHELQHRTSWEPEPAGGPGPAQHWFANAHGFAAFTVAEDRRAGDLRVGRIEDTSQFSTSALMFYGFNLPHRARGAFLQMPQIRLLAATLHGMIQRGRAVGMTYRPEHDRLFVELRAPGLAQLDGTAIAQAVYEFLELHEAGHTHAVRGARPVRDILHRRGLDDRLAPPLDFPTPHQLASWQRITAGRGTVEDVLFLYGDLLSNMTIVAAGIPATTLALLRAFNWWLVQRPVGDSRPSGIAGFLVYSSGSRLDDFARDLGAIIDTALTVPGELARRMLALEHAHWSALHAASP